MECKKCAIHIPSEFEYILSKNVCPKCGNTLMADLTMKMYLDIKKRLQEVEFVMDKNIVCERVAMFIVNNFDVMPMGTKIDIKSNQADVAAFKEKIASLDEEDDLTPEEIRAQEASRAEEIATAREMGIDVLEDGEELVSGKIDINRVERLKKLASSGKSGVMVKRSEV